MFTEAKPIWPGDTQLEMNLLVGLRTCFDKEAGVHYILKLASSGIYRFFVNGHYIGNGPARSAHGYFRLDEWKIDQYLKAKDNVIAIEVVGYNVNSYYIINQPSFLQVELIGDDQVIRATSSKNNDFQAFINDEKIQKVQRYSFQRTFTEIYHLNSQHDLWKTEANYDLNAIPCCEMTEHNIIERKASYPNYDIKTPIKTVSTGKMTEIKLKNRWEPRFIHISETFKGFKEDMITEKLTDELENMQSIELNIMNEDCQNNHNLSKGTFKIFEFPVNNTGYIGADIECKENCELYFVFDEILQDHDINYKRLDCINAVKYALKSGTYHIETMEPYTFKFLKVIAKGNDCRISNPYIREYVNPDSDQAVFSCDDEELNRLFEAGRTTFKQNALDIFMDCPSRERAGWLCDSYFTSQVEKWLTGKSQIETNFLTNYAIASEFKYLPYGMLPMCYPADHNDGTFIPNWSLWFVLELEGYYKRTNDRDLINQLKDKVMALFHYFESFKNEDGLLEKLTGWTFLEWSKANEFTQDVNYPTNMLYAKALSVAGRLFNHKSFIEESKNLKLKILEQSFNGTFFVDNAIRTDGKLVITNHCTEVCQYYAFFMDIADRNTHCELWNILVNQFGPGRKGLYPEVFPANAFIGNYLRLELLSKAGLSIQVIDEMKGYFTYMVNKTGTLWENAGDYASCNHGFASYVVHYLYRNISGIDSIDLNAKTITVKLNALKLTNFQGNIPFMNQFIKINWIKEENNIDYQIKVPADYQVEIFNHTGLNLRPQIINEVNGIKS